MLANECTAACRLASLEPTIGALHATRPGRPALSLDLLEPFRPLIADSIAVSAFNRGELDEGHSSTPPRAARSPTPDGRGSSRRTGGGWTPRSATRSSSTA